MSRIGKQIIAIPQGVECTLGDRRVTVKGPKGSMQIPFHKAVTVSIDPEAKTIRVTVDQPDQGNERALWGLTRQLINNAIIGVQTPFTKSLEFVGVGFRVEVSGRNVKMDVGFSHPVVYELPEGIEASVEKNILRLSGIDKQAVGEVAAQIRRVRPPEPYKGKGIKYVDEVIRRKAGKTGTK